MQKNPELKPNKAQEKVINHPGGPLLVVAGAGTGKTRVIVEKINKLLEQGVDPSAILAVTFTEKAAAEMLERVLLARSGVLLDLQIMTFNGFGDQLLSEYGVHVGLSRRYRLMGDQAQIVFFRERIDQFNLEYFLPLTTSPDDIIANILELFSKLKQNLVSPEAYQSYAGNLPVADEADALDKRKHQELAEAYATYTRLCRSENVIDYDDQIYLSVRLLEQRPNVRRELQEQFKWMFIDEFQDTNPMQSRLIDLLVNDQQNVVVVGDDDQSIYGWRGATLQNILSFKYRYPKAKEVALTQNYRSHQSILDASYKLIKKNDPHRLESTLQIDKQLTSDEPGQAPELKRFSSYDQELYWLGTDIKQRIDQGESPGSIAVLARSRNTAKAVHDALEQAGVAHVLVGYNQNLYSQPVVRMLIELTRTLAEPNNNASLHHTLVSDLFNIPNDLIAPLANKARREFVPLEELLAEPNDDELNRALELVQSLRKDSAAVSVGRLLWRAITDTGYKTKLLERAAGDEEAGASIQYIKQFFDSLRDFESIATQPTAVQYMISLPALMAAGENTDDDTLAINSNEVTISTIHKAKGLEWDTVYVPALIEQTFPIYKRGEGLRPPDELRAVQASPADEHYAEERRLMYVAATRARQNLIISFADKGRTGTRRKPSRFIDEMFGSGSAELTAITDITDQLPEQIDAPIQTKFRVAIPSNIYDGDKVRLTVSQASALLDCPLNFYYKFVLKAPEDPTPSTGYGSYMHSFFEHINKARKNNTLEPLDQYIKELESGWPKSGYASLEQQERAFAQAGVTLTNFYNRCASATPPFLVEESFEVELQPEGIILEGRMDVVLNDGGIEIRDYKTGNSIKDIEAAKKRAGSSSQLTMYALAWQLIHGELPAKVALEFVDTGFVGALGKTQKGIDGLRGRLKSAVDNLKNNSFPAGYSHTHCIHPPIGE